MTAYSNFIKKLLASLWLVITSLTYKQKDENKPFNPENHRICLQIESSTIHTD